MHRWLARTLLAIVTLGILVAPTALDASPALAAWCNTNSCTGKDPIAMGCASGAQTIDSFILVPDFYVELRYSATCNAAWARVTNHWYSNNASQNLFVQIRGYSCSAANSSCFVGQYSQQALFGTDYTDMFSFAYWVRACDTNWPTGDPLDCTAQH